MTSPNTSSSSSTEEEKSFPSKRYKLPLHVGYKPSDVSRQTQRRWEQRRAKQSSKSTIDTESHREEFNASNSSPELDSRNQVDTVDHGVAMDTAETSEMIHNIPASTSRKNSDEAHGEYMPNIDEFISSSEENELEENLGGDTDVEDIQSEVDSSESDNDDDINADQKIDVLDQIMFRESNLKVRDVLTMITALSLALKIPDEGKLKLGKFAKILAGERFDSLNLSKYMMDQCFSSQDEYVTYHFYCSSCVAVKVYSIQASEKRRNKEVICEGCRAKNKITPKSSNYFLGIDIRYQFEQLISDPSLIDDIFKNVQSRNTDRDINAGSIHKSIVASSKNQSDIILTVNMNTDGAPLTKSGKRGFWPVQIILNDLSPRLRFRNVLVSGLLLTETEPKSNLLNLYLRETFVNQINLLYNEGIEVTYKGKDVVFKFCFHACPVDSVCRPIIQNRIQFNGYHGCSWGYQLGKYITSVRGIRYPVTQSETERNNDAHKEDVANAIDGKIINGVKGDSAMSELPHCDMVWGFPYEYLHALCGVVLQIWNEWKNGESIFKINKNQVDCIEKRYLNITPTQDIHRLPRSGILKGSGKPKAAELKSWLLVHSLPCLRNILDDDALRHYSLLVSAAFIALKPFQTEEELEQCDDDLLKFEVGYQENYGEEKMTFNVHTLRHIVKSIRKTGSLCYNSAFPFESNIFTLKTYVNGPKGMDRQMSRKHLQHLLFKTGNIKDVSSSERTVHFCSSLFNPIKFSKSFRHGQDIVYCGKSELKNITGLGECLVYKRCIYKNTVYHSEKYVASKKTNDSVVQLMISGQYAKIINIIEHNANSYAQLRIFNLYPEDPFPGVQHIKQIHSEHNDKVIRRFSEIDSKVILVNSRNSRYLCKIPNNFEIQ